MYPVGHLVFGISDSDSGFSGYLVSAPRQEVSAGLISGPSLLSGAFTLYENDIDWNNCVFKVNEKLKAKTKELLLVT